MRPPPLLCPVGAIVACLVFAPFAASPARAASAGDRAERLKRQAFKHIAEGSYALGIDELEAAYRLVPHPTLLFNIAVVYDQWPGHCEEAFRAFDRLFETCRSERCDIEETARVRYERVRLRCEVTLSIDTTPGGADVTIDDTPQGPAPVTVPMRPGPHAITVEKPGFRTETKDVTLLPGQNQAIDLALQPTSSPASRPPAASGDAALRGSVDRPSSLRPWMWTSFGVAVAGGVLGGVFTGLALDSANREEALRMPPAPQPPDPDAVNALRDEARTREAVAIAGYSTLAAGAVAGVLFYFLEPPALPAQAHLDVGLGHVRLSARF